MKRTDVLKFGGSCWGSRDTILQMRGVIRSHYSEDSTTAVVISALGVLPDSKERKTTDQLFGVAEHVLKGNTPLALQAYEAILVNHLAKAKGVDVSESAFAREFDELRHMIESPLEHTVEDAIRASFVRLGEQKAGRFLAALLNESGIPALYLDASEHGFITDSSYLNARLLNKSLDETIALEFQKISDANPGKVLVYTGYIARNQKGEWTVLGRDGSNATALALGAAVNARRIIIYTDVPGVLKVPPKVLPKTQTVRVLSYPEVKPLAEGGVKVFQAESLYIQRHKEHLPPVLLKSLHNPDDPGTLVTAQAAEGHSVMKGIGVIGNLSYRQFPLYDDLVVDQHRKSQSQQFQEILDIISGWEGAEVVWSSHENQRTGRFLVKVDLEMAQADKDHFRGKLFHEIRREVYCGRKIKGSVNIHGLALITVGGYNIGWSPGARAHIQEALEPKFPYSSLRTETERHLHQYPYITERHAVRLVFPEGEVPHVAHRLYQTLKRINIVLFGPGVVGQAFLGKVCKAYDELGLNVVGVVDSEGYVTRVGGLTRKEVADIVSYKQSGKKFDGSQIGRLVSTSKSRGHRPFSSACQENAQILRELLTCERGDFTLIDATDSEHMLDTLALAIKEGVPIISANKLPYVVNPRVRYVSKKKLGQLYKAVANRRALNRATVGANLGVPDTLLEILSTAPEQVTISGCMSGTLGYISSRIDEGARFSEAVAEAINAGYTEPKPYEDLSGRDVLNKTRILWRMIAYHYRIKFDERDVRHKTFIEPVIRAAMVRWGSPGVMAIEHKEGEEFASSVQCLDDAFLNLWQQAGEDMVWRYVGAVKFHKGIYHIEVGLKPVHRESILGNLTGTDNAFLFGTNGESQRIYFPPGPGAGVDVTSQALFDCLERCVQKFRS